MTDIKPLRYPRTKLQCIKIRHLQLEPIDIQNKNFRHLPLNDHLLFSLVFALRSLKRANHRLKLPHLLNHHHNFVLNNFKFGLLIGYFLPVVVDQCILSVYYLLSIDKMKESILMTSLYLGLICLTLTSYLNIGVK